MIQQALINLAVQAARTAGDSLVRALHRPHAIKIYQHGSNTYTDAEQQITEHIIKIIGKPYANHQFISSTSENSPNTSDSCWFIDPSGNTTNFIHGLPHGAIVLAYTYQERIEHSVIYDPWRQELFVASRGRGAYLNERRLRLNSTTKTLNHCLVGLNYDSDSTRDASHLDGITSFCSGIRYSGTPALDLAYVASSRLDASCTHSSHPWQTYAGLLLVKEAGGMVCDIDGSENYYRTGNLVAGSANTVKQLLVLIKNLNCR